MVRPATPLSVLFFIAFAFLLLSSLSTPIVKAIPLGTYGGVNFGTFGFCRGTKCSPIALGYSMSSLFTDNNGAGDFSLPTSLRNTVSVALIIHPIAALLCLICLILAITAHFHSPSHSVRYLLGLFILTIPTLFASLAAFLVDVLLFIPNVAWGGWIVLAATIILLIASVITCGMRRSLVSRKERRKRIAENAEMSGENYFENRNAEMATLPKPDSPPPLSGDTISSSSENGAGFASFDLQPVSSTDDRVPLNPSAVSSQSDIGRGPYGEQGPPGRWPPRDQYGNPLPQDAMEPALRRQEFDNFMGSTPSSRPSGPRPVYGRGRGGYPPPMAGRGGYPPRGGMMRGGPQGMRGPPPPGWGGRGRGMPSGGMMGRGGYPPGPPRGGYYGGPGGGAPDRMMMMGGRGPPMDSAGPIGQAVELDEQNGLPSPSQSRPSSSPGNGEIPGMVGMMQQPRQLNDRGLVSPTSDYEHPQSPEPYVPPRAQWIQKSATPAVLSNRSLSPIEASPISQRFDSPPRLGLHAPLASDNYVEDIDPQFEASAIAPTIPTSLMPGPPPPDQTANPPPSNAYLQPSGSFPSNPYGSSSDLPNDEQRSPAASESSQFTSVSQRGVNPNWRPPPGSAQRPPPGPSRNDILLNGNPDFTLPVTGSGQAGRGGYRGGRAIGPLRGGPPPPTMGMDGPMPPMDVPGGRYPGAY